MIEIRVDQRQLGDLLAKLGHIPRGLARATSMAGNKTLVTIRANMVRMIRERYAIKAGDVRKELAISRLTPSRLVGSIRGESSPGVPLFRFTTTRRLPSTRRTRAGGYTPAVGISVLVRKDRGKRVVRGAFTAVMSSGHRGAFVRGSRYKAGRETKSKLGAREIVELYGPTPVKLLGAAENIKKIETQAQDTMDKNLKREAEFYLRRAGLL